MIVVMKLVSGESVIADLIDIEVINETTNAKAMRVRLPYVVSSSYRDFTLTPMVIGVTETEFHIAMKHVMFYLEDGIDRRLYDKYTLICGPKPK